MTKLGAWRLPSAVAEANHAEIRVKAGSELITHLQCVTERDNARVARLLHDELGGLIVAAIMDIGWWNPTLKRMSSIRSRSFLERDRCCTLRST